MVLSHYWLLLWQATRIFQGLGYHRLIKNNQIRTLSRVIIKNILRYTGTL